MHTPNLGYGSLSDPSLGRKSVSQDILESHYDSLLIKIQLMRLLLMLCGKVTPSNSHPIVE